MRFTIGLALVAALGAAACKKKSTSAEAVGSGSAVGSAPGSGSAGSAEQAAAPPPIDAATGPWQVPAGASAGSGDADATALGNAVVAHLVERVKKLPGEDKYRDVKVLLVLEGGGKSIVADETSAYAQDGSAAAMAIKTSGDIVRPPLTPPRPLQGSDIEGGGDYELDFKGPLLFLVYLESNSETREIAVGKDQDSLGVWSLDIPKGDSDVAPEWQKTGTIKLAPGATVTAAGSGS